MTFGTLGAILSAFRWDRRRSCMDAWRCRSCRQIFSNPRPGCKFFPRFPKWWGMLMSPPTWKRWGSLDVHIDHSVMQNLHNPFTLSKHKLSWAWRFTLYACFAGRQRDRLEGKGAKGNGAKVVWCILMFVPTAPPFNELHQPAASSLGGFFLEGLQRIKGGQQA